MKKSMRLMSQIYSLLLLIGVIFCMSSSLRADDLQDFTFDDSLLLGGGYGDSYLSRFNSIAETIPGQYQVDIYINGTYLNPNSTPKCDTRQLSS
ncbi:FimD/PapC N-terminal domain-containing protein [Shewanella oncorhynchi]|uniref:FimD/PapC N-terminal domain-containing protein n=1 Tax=Shewanella oncorhynchi TaxID=2726434 RepID=UPI003D7B77E9